MLVVCQFAKFVATGGKLLCHCKALAIMKLRHGKGHVCHFAKGNGARGRVQKDSENP
jgi:hypothetical protein